MTTFRLIANTNLPMSNRRIVLTIAGSDPSGGAGTQADLRVIQALGCYGVSVVTAITAQSTLGVSKVWPLSPQQVEEQAKVLLSDIKPDAVKIGMLGDAEVGRAVLRILEQYALSNVVADTIMLSSSGTSLYETDDLDTMRSIMQQATIVTPNLPEAERLLGYSSSNAEQTAREISRLCGGVSVLLKGGHTDGDVVADTLYNNKDNTMHYFTHSRIDTINTHGTGCTLSSALACFLAQGYSVLEASERAVAFMHKALSDGRALRLGSGHGPAFFG